MRAHFSGRIPANSHATQCCELDKRGITCNQCTTVGTPLASVKSMKSTVQYNQHLPLYYNTTTICHYTTIQLPSAIILTLLSSREYAIVYGCTKHFHCGHTIVAPIYMQPYMLSLILLNSRVSIMADGGCILLLT